MDAKMTKEQMLDAAAGEALGVNTPESSAAYHAASEGDAALIRTERELREAVARLAAASPYLEPREELRGRILQATAPQTFKMADYRQAGRENRIYRWGFYAAAVFLMAAAYFNLNMQTKVKNLETALIQSQQQVATVSQQSAERGLALTQVLDPNTNQIRLTRDGKVGALAFVNNQTRTGVMIVAAGSIPAGHNAATLTVEHAGVPTEYKTLLVAADGLPNWAGGSFDKGVHGTNLQPAPSPVFEANLLK